MTGHLREGALLAAKLDGHGTAEFLVLLSKLRLLGLDGDVLLAEEFNMHGGLAVVNFVAVLGEAGALGVLKKELRELELTGLEARLNLLHEVEVGFLGLGAVGVTGHRDVAT